MKKNRQTLGFVNIILCLVMVVTLCSCGKKAADPVTSEAPVSEASQTGTQTAEAPVSEASQTGTQTAEAPGTEEVKAEEPAEATEEPAADETPEETPEEAAEVSEEEETPEESEEDSTGMTAEELIEKINGPEEIGVFDYVEYVKKKNVESYLALGIDRGGEYGTSSTYYGGGQSDLMMLLVLDKDAKTFTAVQINRDTMASVDVLDVFGNPINQITTQITRAYAFGDGSSSSAENACRAVSNLFGGIDIDGYVAVNYGAVPGMNDAVGGVTVTIEDDFTSLDPEMAPGATVTLNGDQAILFCRSRMSVGDGHNTSRMRRQSVYMNAFMKACKGAAKGRSAVINDVYNAAKPYMTSNMNWNSMSNAASMILSYSNKGIKSITGSVSIVKYQDGNSYAEFNADSGNIADIVKELYYTEK